MHLSRFAASVGALAVALLLSIPATGFAQSNNVAVVDVQAILKKSLAAKSVRGQVQAMSRDLSEDARKVRDDLRKQEDDLVAKRAILSPERFDEMRRKLAEEAKDHQVAFNKRQHAIERSANAAMDRVQDVFQEVASQIAKERNVTMVFSKTLVVLFPSEMDITAEVLKRMDQKLPKVAVATPR